MSDKDYGFGRRGATKNRGLGTGAVPPEPDGDDIDDGELVKPALFDTKAWAIGKWGFVPIYIGPDGIPDAREKKHERHDGRL